MKIIALAHEPSLKYAAMRDRLDFDQSWLAVPSGTTLYTFARTSYTARKISALERLKHQYDGDVVLSFFAVSPLFALLTWDIAHAMPVGSTLYLHNSDNVAGLLTSSYYQLAFKEINGLDAGDCRAFIKTDRLPAEAERGLDGWSFCIPTGDGDPECLNACIARILELGIPHFEIILCGRPAPGFSYWSRVRIIGEDITEPPLHITRKKNLLVGTARFNNLCILHDRVLLPRNFYSAIQRMGDDYPLTGFQSFWFAGRGQTLPLRYSDFGVADTRPFDVFPSERLARQDIPHLASLALHTQHPARSDFGRDYLTGSLYMCKRAVWQHIPQNEKLFWLEYEDVEQAMAAAAAGVPSRINPYSFTRSLSYRTIMHHFGRVTGRTYSGRRVSERPWGMFLLPRQPHSNITETHALERMQTFCKRYGVSSELLSQMPAGLSGIKRYILITRLLWAFRGDTTELLNDWYHLILCESPVPVEKESLASALAGSVTPENMKLAWLRHPTLVRQVFNNPFSSPFKPDEPVRCSRTGLWLGSLLCALWLCYGSRHSVLRMSFWAVWRELVSSAMTAREKNYYAK
ncbi:hypothetical protein BJP35_0010 [Enterobacter sp. J49]|uniref:hypothetical protein n=1 Tax=Enterobacter sp. J49 TaxID=1903627 RepID=UPI000A3C9987|nr:hypothetical protein [Enterobacter sp. J49]OUC39422.1 hypothetical protein BJP35_0010 [Enterobacter sp. J49]